ncbi:MAG: protein translocase subunit SecD [Hyphomicrobiaceae bacterium]|nr:protein translocase subunit SecD [Hyphomicrobiaceae bacterium]
MLLFSRWKILAIVLTCLAGIAFSIPNFFAKETVASWPSWLPKKQLSLGLDLKGGAHLLLAMDANELRKDWLQNIREDVRKQLRDAKIGFTAIGVTGTGIQVTLLKPEETDKAETELKKLIQPIGNAILGSSGTTLKVETGTTPGQIIVTPTEQAFNERLSSAAGAAVETVNRRVNALGTTEPNIVRQGADRILVQVPGFDDTKSLKELIGKTAKLTFHDVHPQIRADEAQATRVPLGYKIYPSDTPGESALVLREVPVVPGDDLVDAQPGFDHRTNEPIISFRFNQAGARKFGTFTKDNVGRPFAIVLDNKVLSAPVIREAILGGSGQISGSFTVETANQLAIQLRSGALPTPLTVIEERTVGPSLGADSITAGVRAGIIGGLATLIMTITVYGTFGVYAVIGLILNGFLIVGLMTAVGSTLTLPGIAGLVLTIGMAVDANVLIFERIREELRAGKSAIASIDAGFTRAMVTIADSQLTTLVAAFIMFWLGSGPIRGFAVTLTIGIFTSVFTAVTVTRLLIALWLRNAKSGKAKISVPV